MFVGIIIHFCECISTISLPFPWIKKKVRLNLYPKNVGENYEVNKIIYTTQSPHHVVLFEVSAFQHLVLYCLKSELSSHHLKPYLLNGLDQDYASKIQVFLCAQDLTHTLKIRDNAEHVKHLRIEKMISVCFEILSWIFLNSSKMPCQAKFQLFCVKNLSGNLVYFCNIVFAKVTILKKKPIIYYLKLLSY